MNSDLAKPAPRQMLGELIVGCAQERVTPPSGEDTETAGDRDTETEYEASGSRARLRALVVDDNPVNRALLVKYLQAMGIPADEVEDGESGVARADERRPGLVLMDIHMPGISGEQAAARIRDIDDYQPYVVAVSADAGKVDHLRRNPGVFDAALAKPVYEDRLEEIIREGTGYRRGEPVAPRDQSDLERRFLLELYQDLPRIRELHDAEEWGQLARQLHRLKGAAIFFAPESFANTLEAYELAAKRAALDALALEVSRFLAHAEELLRGIEHADDEQLRRSATT